MLKKTTQYILLLFALFLVNHQSYGAGQKAHLSGTVVDKNTGEKLPGATVYFPDLKTGCITDINGSFQIENLPFKKLVVQFRLLGYKNLIKIIDHTIT